MEKQSISKISLLHYVKLVFRSLLLLGITLEYLYRRLVTGQSFYEALDSHPFFLTLVWFVFVVEMLLRLFPSSLESPGSQKQFRRCYRPASPAPDLQGRRIQPDTSAGRVLAALAAWVALNGIIAALFFTHVIDEGILVIISLFYSVSDMICILFFCPFQSWIMQNRCCTTCRIYNWDYPMMFTPMLFIRSFYSASLVFLSLILLVRWEWTAFRHPERFSEEHNLSLHCANCPEKLCKHKKQLRTLWKRQRLQEKLRLQRLSEKL